MTLIQTLLISVIQGITELFPISSVAHAVLTPFVFGWDLTPKFLKDHFLPFVVMLHLGTAVALLVFFWRDWLDFAKSTIDSRATVARAILVRVIIGSVPAAIIGLLLEKQLKSLFSSVTSAALFLIVNGAVLYFGEKLRGRGAKRIEEIGYVDALLVGLAQASALVPGFLALGRQYGRRFLDRVIAWRVGAVLDAARHADHRRRRAARSAQAVPWRIG